MPCLWKIFLLGVHDRFDDCLSRLQRPVGIEMRNDECVIYVMNSKEDILQTYQTEKSGWTQTGRNGVVRPMTAEQLLSHILPPLAGVSSARVRVERKAV
jgi:hypothetical protein